MGLRSLPHPARPGRIVGERGHHRRARGIISTLAVATVAVLGAGCAVATAASTHPGSAGSGTAATPAAPTPTAAPAVSIAPTGGGPINPRTPIAVTARVGRLSSVQVVNVVRHTTVTGAFSADHHSWHSTEPLGYGARYTVTAHTQTASGGSATQAGTVSTLAPAHQASATLTPDPGSVSTGGVGIGQPLVIHFSRPVADEQAVQRALTVTSSPAQPGDWYWMDHQTVHYRPKRFWTPGTTLKLSAHIYGQDLGGGTYGAADVSARYHVHDSWLAKADGSTDQMRIYHSGKLVKTIPISMGKGATPTHSGIHVVSSKSREVRMNSCTYGVCSGPKAYNVIEHWAERISTDGEFVHENPDSVTQQGHTNVSHGCINLNKANAEWFYAHFGPGDVVEVSHSGGPALPVWDTYGDWSLNWNQWQAGNSG
ncbi:MAG: Ig-like domain-containing protein [Sciscionella sp.]